VYSQLPPKKMVYAERGRAGRRQSGKRGIAAFGREIALMLVTKPIAAVRLMKIDTSGFTVCGP
jgi:hypothetical protein